MINDIATNLRNIRTPGGRPRKAGRPTGGRMKQNRQIGAATILTDTALAYVAIGGCPGLSGLSMSKQSNEPATTMGRGSRWAVDLVGVRVCRFVQMC
jgi:hypothetical protein